MWTDYYSNVTGKIYEVKVCEDDNNYFTCIGHTSKSRSYDPKHGSWWFQRHCHETKEAAIKSAEYKLKRRITSLKKQLERLEGYNFSEEPKREEKGE